jgi:hypothetical protein
VAWYVEQPVGDPHGADGVKEEPLTAEDALNKKTSSQLARV